MLVTFIPAILTAVSAFFFYWSFSYEGRSYWLRMAIALFAFFLTLCLLVYWTVIDGGLLAFIASIIASFVAFLAGLMLFFISKRTTKYIGILMGLAIPLAMFATIWIAEDFSYTSVLRRNGIALAQIIDQYKNELGHYPPTLEELKPRYVSDLKAPDDYWGWLYYSTDEAFTLGYVFHIGKFGYSLCLIHSTNRTWDCLMDSTGPFTLGPTPTPSQNPVR